jgi:type II secretory pathway predicted ATPase ExeA
MYLNHYNLTLKPFEISPDPRFLWLGEKHNEALAAMKYGILDNKGFICLTGDVGTGKTTLVNALISSSEKNIIFAKFSDPPLDKLDFFNLAADAFGMNKKFSTKGDFISHLRRFLNNAYDHNQEVVLVIEEAQRFDQEQLEEVRLISNIERPDKKLISIIFVGQNEFDGILHKNKPLRQRVSIIHKILPLQEIETKQYVLHRLKVAGSKSEIFSPGAFREIYSFTEGNPRLINIICDLALLTGYAENRNIIEPETIRECALSRLLPTQQKEAVAEHVKASSIPSVKTAKGAQPGRLEDSPQILAKKMSPKATRFKLTYATSIFMVLLLSFVGYLYFYGDNHAPYRDFKTSLGQTFDRYIGSKLETSSQETDEIATQQSSITGTKIQALDFAAQKASFENQLDQLKSRNEALAADLAELNGAKDRMAELEGVAANREQALSEAKQKITELTNALDQEKKGQDLLRAELSTNADQVTEVQQKLEERVAALEGELATKDQALSQAEQKVAELTNALDQEKKGQDLLRAELSTNADQVTEAQQKLESSQATAIKFQEEVERYKKDTAALQGQLSELQTQKTAVDGQLDQLKSLNKILAADLAELNDAKERITELEQQRSSYDELSADSQELRDVEERVAALEGELARKDQALSQAEQKITDLTSALDREKINKETLISERSIKADLVAELQGKLEAALSSRAELENDVEKSREEIVALQRQLIERREQQVPAKPSPAIVDVKKESPSQSEAVAEQGEQPSPNDVIDYVFKKKAK